jgi:hypothetical protein
MTLQYVCSQRRMAEEFYLSFLDMLRINKLDSIRLATFIDIYFFFFHLVLSKRKFSYELRMFNFLIESNVFQIHL